MALQNGEELRLDPVFLLEDDGTITRCTMCCRLHRTPNCPYARFLVRVGYYETSADTDTD